uniref:Uncharacterized protein n=1 Tax=Arundo donax TaxID=35708 RepID=A0A0A9AHJ2_ARUDO
MQCSHSYSSPSGLRLSEENVKRLAVKIWPRPVGCITFVLTAKNGHVPVLDQTIPSPVILPELVYLMQIMLVPSLLQACP